MLALMQDAPRETPPTGPYRSPGRASGEGEQLPAYLRVVARRWQLPGDLLYPAALVSPALILAYAAWKLGPPGAVCVAPFAGVFVSLWALLIISRRVGYRVARERVKEAFRTRGADHARRLAEDELRTVARRPWLWPYDERERALVGYAGICLSQGDVERVAALRALCPSWTYRPVFAMAAALAGDDASLHASALWSADRDAHPHHEWIVVSVVGRLAGATAVKDARVSWEAWDALLDETHRDRLAYVEGMLGSSSGDTWPARLDPWNLLLLEHTFRWLDRAGPGTSFPSVRALVRRERARLA